MGAFLALAWTDGDPEARSEAEGLQARLDAADDWTSIHRGQGFELWSRGPNPPSVRAHGPIVIVGNCLDRGSTDPYRPIGLVRNPSNIALAHRLCSDAWGAFVAILGGEDGRGIYRDPSGGLDCLTWRVGRVRVIMSDAGAPPDGFLPPRCALDWDVIAAWCFDSGSAATQAGLDGVEVVPPGFLLDITGEEGRRRPIWRPSRFVERSGGRGRPGDGLVEAVGLAVEGLLRPHERVVQEISGGLDSAIVAAALVGRGLRNRVVTSLNYHGDRPEGDERAYAKAVASRLRLPLDCADMPIRPLTEDDFAEASKGLRPGFATVDPDRDRSTADKLRSAQATALVTGHGGDVVFFQMPTPLIALDRRRASGIAGLSTGFIGDLARYTRRPAWSILQTLLSSRPPEVNRPPGLAPPGAASSWIDPWTADCAEAPPAKRFQVTTLFRAQLALGWSHRGRAADVVHPLLSQPVVEYCLGLTTVELTEGRRDRALARQAFREQLPALVVDRRSKGNLSAHYGRVIAASLDFLRPLLLEGRLVEAGLLDRGRLAAALTPEGLILHRANSEILVAALIESWVRWWQTRAPDSPRAPRPR